MFWFIANNHCISLVYRLLGKWKTCIFIYPSQYLSNMQGFVQGKIFFCQMFGFSVQHAVWRVRTHTSMIKIGFTPKIPRPLNYPSWIFVNPSLWKKSGAAGQNKLLMRNNANFRRGPMPYLVIYDFARFRPKT